MAVHELSGKAEYNLDSLGEVLIENGPNAQRNTGVRVRNSSKGAHITGGKVRGTGVNLTGSWAKVHATNGAGLIVETIQEVLVERLRLSWTWDGLRIANDSPNPTFQACWFDNVRDDGFELDHTQATKKATIHRCLVEDVHTFLSATPGKGLGQNPGGDASIGSDPKIDITMIGCL